MEEVRFDVRGEGHVLEISPSARIKGQIKVSDDAGPCAVRIGAGVTGNWNLSVAGGATVSIGAGTTCETALVVARGSDVLIGEDCMFSFSVEIRTTDTHAIYDIDSGGRVNPDRPIVIGDHVWLGKQVVVLKGASIGSGSVAGARSIVSGDIPPLSVAAGVPARVVRSNVVWTRRIGQGRLALDDKAMAVVGAVRTSA